MAASRTASSPSDVSLHHRVGWISAAPAPAVTDGGVGRDARRWFSLAVSSLVVAGLLSISVVFGRLPGIARFIDDPLFFKRCLVVHVDLALVVWFYAFLAGLNALRTGAGFTWIGRGAFWISLGGVSAMLGGALMRGAQPVLANYVPVINHPLFLGGIAAFLVGTLLFLLEALGTTPRGPAASVASRILPVDAATGLQAAAIAFVLAAATWVATRASMPAGLDPWTRFEFSAWGAGHVLQVANAAAMVAVWLWLLSRATGRCVLDAGRARMVFTLLLAPHFAMPLLTARGAMDSFYHSGATQLMRWGIFPVVLVVLALGLRHLRCHGVVRGDPLALMARTGFAASASLTLLGFILGACIRSSTTLVPAHYHASLGGVTVAFMTAAYLVCAAVRRANSPSGLSRDLTSAPVERFDPKPLNVRAGVSRQLEVNSRSLEAAAIPGRSARRQLALFGFGQAVFALGFGIGGIYGLGRKAYAGEQHVRSTGELVGLGVMGVGGLFATIAGVWFLMLVLRAMARWWTRPSTKSVALASNFP